jgi:hypothetical protein
MKVCGVCGRVRRVDDVHPGLNPSLCPMDDLFHARMGQSTYLIPRFGQKPSGVKDIDFASPRIKHIGFSDSLRTAAQRASGFSQ